MTWYKKVIAENKKEIIRGAITSLAITFTFSIWYFFSHQAFEWTNYNFVSKPTLSLRLLSGLVFVSLGHLFYKLKVYYVLYFILVVLLKIKTFYNKLKKIIWYSLMFITGFFIVPWVINIINVILSFFYNLWLLILYILPPLGIFLVIFLVIIWLLSKKNGSKMSYFR